MRGFLRFSECLRLLIVHYYNPTYTTEEIMATVPGATPEEKARNCCRVCRDGAKNEYNSSDFESDYSDSESDSD